MILDGAARVVIILIGASALSVAVLSMFGHPLALAAPAIFAGIAFEIFTDNAKG